MQTIRRGAQPGSITPAACLALLCMSVGCQQPRGDLFDRLVVGDVLMHAEFAANLRAIALPGGRVSGTSNAEEAASFVANKCRTYGLANVHFEPFEMQSWIVNRTQVSVLPSDDMEPRAIEGAVALARTQSTPPDGVTAEIADLGEDPKPEVFAEHAAEIREKFVFVREGETRRMKLVKLAVEHGAAGLVIMCGEGHNPVIGNGHAEPRPEPIVVIPYDKDLVERLKSGAHVRLNIALETENWPCRPNNVVAEIPGRGPLAREVVILCAHLDGWHLGEAAMDNGSGSAAILETARALAGLRRAGGPVWQPRRTVRFVWFMGEELGLLGSEAYVRQHATELDRVVAVINADMPGAPRTIGVIGHPELGEFVKAVRSDLAGFELEQAAPEEGGDGSDYAPFMHAGVATMNVWGELGPGVQHYHQAGDKFDTVNRRWTVQSSAVYGVLLRRLADAPVRPSMRKPAQRRRPE